MTSQALLQKYHQKRNFQRTPEPKGQRDQRRHIPIFVIQKHAASHLHYDFRLEAAGVLKSWAVPKGPSTDPHVKRLAVQVEDHPLDYADFEGVIPQGQYGGGNVIVWDTGPYENLTVHKGQPLSISQGIERGHISFRLNGGKLHGAYALTRIRPGSKPQWLLVKIQDENANEPADPVQSLPQSVLSGLTIENVSEGKAVRHWTSHRSQATPAKISTPAVKSGEMPAWITPMLATLVDQPFDRAGWIYEPKLDGERCLAYGRKNSIHLFTRNQKSITATYPELLRALKKQKADSFILDGEIVTYEPGTQITSFKRLQQRMHLHNERDIAKSKVKVVYCLFDILYLNGGDLRKRPLLERKDILKRALTWTAPLQLNPYIKTGGEQYYRQACRNRWEGVIAKRSDSVYTAGRSQDWLKFKCVSEQEFVIGGYTDPEGSRDHFGALLIGYYEGSRLKFAGKVGTGFDDAALRQLAGQFRSLERKTSPFAAVDLPKRGLHWLEPKLVAQIGFGEWTEEGKLRQPRFVGLRDDKSPRDVTRETKAMALPQSPAAIPKTTPTISSSSSQLEIDKHTVNVSNLKKVFYPSSGFTKGQMLDYYIQVAPVLLPHLRGRPLTLKRYPDGVEGGFFYEKQAPSYRPPWLHTALMEDQKTGKKTNYVVIDDLASLVWIANLATIELHSLLARLPRLDTPTLIAFDLDPGAPAGLLEAMSVGLSLRKILDELKLKSFPKTSGGKGLHVYIPINQRTTYKETQDFAHAIALLLEHQNPKGVVSNMRKDLRQGKVLVDWSQNTRHKTTVSPYSLRAQSAPFVSTPVTWEEVARAVASKQRLQFTAEEVLKRLRDKKDIFAPVQTLKQTLPHLGKIREDSMAKTHAIVKSNGNGKTAQGPTPREGRGMWSGSISFGLVNIPIKLYPGIRPKSVQFHLLHEKDNARLQEKLVCPVDHEEVSRSEAAKGFEIAKGQHVIVSQEEIDSVAPKASRTIELLNVVDIHQIDPMYFDRPFYLLPDERAVKAYMLLTEALRSIQKGAIVKFVMRNKEYIGALRPIKKVLCLDTLHFADELVSVNDLGWQPPASPIKDAELKMAVQLLESLKSPFEPQKLHDDYREQLLQMIHQKAEGHEIAMQPEVESEGPEVIDLMGALKKSVEEINRRKSKKVA